MSTTGVPSISSIGPTRRRQATYTIGRVMVVQAVRWASEVVGAQRAKEILEDD
jgi:hypothetical protein